MKTKASCCGRFALTGKSIFPLLFVVVFSFRSVFNRKHGEKSVNLIRSLQQRTCEVIDTKVVVFNRFCFEHFFSVFLSFVFFNCWLRTSVLESQRHWLCRLFGSVDIYFQFFSPLLIASSTQQHIRFGLEAFCCVVSTWAFNQANRLPLCRPKWIQMRSAFFLKYLCFY